MSFFDFLKGKKPAAVTYRLIWFELQVTPFAYRFAIMPEQPILIGLEGEKGAKGVTMLIRYEHSPTIYDQTVEKVDALIAKHGIRSLTPRAPQLAFTEPAITRPGVHVRVAYADGTRWASVYEDDTRPGEISALILETKALARQIIADMPAEVVDAETARQQLERDRNEEQKKSAQVIVRLKVTTQGLIFANKREVTIAELNSILDELKAKNGVVWYSREAPNEELSDATLATVKEVIDIVMIRKLPIRLQEEEY